MRIKTIIASLFKVLAFTLALSVLLPTAVKLSHVFNHHEHEVCENDDADTSTHFHEFDLDCDFYKFKLTQNQYFLVYDYDETLKISDASESLPYYISFNDHQHLTRYLRGPPQLI